MRISDWSSDVCSSDLRNIVDDYIRRRGWNESGSTKIYLRALRSSVMSLYEVNEVEPGSGFLVRDLIQGDEPLRVSERSASQTLKQWDRIGARVVQVGGKHLLSGGVLSFTMEAAEAPVADLRRSTGKRSPPTALNLDADDLAGIPALISTAWLFDVVPKTMGPAQIPRSDKHTSELQSLMRISYAVFCLKKK